MVTLIRRDIQLAFRAGGGFGLALGFFLILAILLPLGIGPDPAPLRTVAPGVLWVGALLGALLSLERIFSTDFEDGTLEALATAPMPMEAVAMGKAVAHWITTGVPLTLAAPILGILLNLAPPAYATLVLTLLIGTPALSFIGTFGAALTFGLKRGGLLLSILVLPLYLPTLVFGTLAVRRAAEGLAGDGSIWFLAGISVGTIALLPIATGAAIRVNLR